MAQLLEHSLQTFSRHNRLRCRSALFFPFYFCRHAWCFLSLARPPVRSFADLLLVSSRSVTTASWPTCPLTSTISGIGGAASGAGGRCRRALGFRSDFHVRHFFPDSLSLFSLSPSLQSEANAWDMCSRRVVTASMLIEILPAVWIWENHCSGR